MADLRGRPRSIRPEEAIAMAKKVGRHVRHGRHAQTYVRPGWNALPIPTGGPTLALGTAIAILDQLDDDITAIEASLPQDEGSNEDDE